MAEFMWPGYDGLQRRLGRFVNPDCTDLMENWERIIATDNREGVLAGTDGWGRPLAPLAPSTLKKRKGSGPPLAPMGASSRVINNFVTANGRDGSSWVAIGAWENVLSTKGVTFLPFHFRGEGRLPRRDLAHVRPEGIRRAREALRVWAQLQLGGTT